MKIHKFTTSQKTYGAVVFALAAGLSVFVTVRSMSLDQSVITSSPQARAELPPSLVTVSEFGARVVEAGVPATSVALDGTFEAQKAARASWQMGSVKAETPAIPLSERISDYAIVELPQVAALPVVGEVISLPLLHGKSFVAVVESANNLANGDYSWSGHVQGYGTDYPVIMTYGEHSVFATITTPDGSYTMESINGLGWLYKNPAEVELSHPGAKDFLEIESQH